MTFGLPWLKPARPPARCFQPLPPTPATPLSHTALLLHGFMLCLLFNLLFKGEKVLLVSLIPTLNHKAHEATDHNKSNSVMAAEQGLWASQGLEKCKS